VNWAKKDNWEWEKVLTHDELMRRNWRSGNEGYEPYLCMLWLIEREMWDI
jgi:hypothetical protein